MRLLRHLAVGLAVVVLLLVGAIAFSLYDPLSGGPHLLSQAQLITASSANDQASLITGEQPIETTDPAWLTALAKRYQPTVVVSTEDRFWPVSLVDALHLRFDGHTTCLYRGGRCRIRDPLPSEMSRASSPSDYLAYPTPLDNVRDSFVSAAQELGIAIKTIDEWQHHPAAVDPFASAQIYFYYLRRARANAYRGVPRGLVSLEYWFYYPLNYFPLVRIPLEALSHPITSTLGNTDYHQGDWEHVVVLLDPKTMRPRYLWMARHANEGEAYRWHSTSVQWEGDHPVIYSALGSHTSYAHCGIQRRTRTYFFINDYVICTPHEDYGFTYSATPLVDLGHTNWACWRGHFGIAGSHLTRSRYGLVPFETDGPFSPLYQQENFGSACRVAPGTRPAPPAL